ncbi:hypothetical protein MNBD_GAMMA15-1215 [hydrothermal vent metagenome]|uniref:Type IV fimbrial biogenesis protein PilW n=1 Tax=hydrothermal vent metagenome TaxID=652676 RepID=A0A3B0YF31_9ZZZZ
MLLSVILLGGVVQVYSSSKQTYRVTENMALMQANSRFAMSVLTREIRMAGFSPCLRTDEVAVTVNSISGTTLVSNLSTGSITGFEGGSSTFPADFPGVGSAPGDRIVGSDGFVVLRGGDATYNVTYHEPSSATIHIVNSTGLNSGDLLLVCDAKNTAIFQATNVPNPAGLGDDTLEHSTGSLTPGNCSTGLGFPTNCTNPGTAYSYGSDAQVVKLTATVYYLGISQSGNGQALYRRPLDTNTGGVLAVGTAQELVDGIESLQILYGETDGSNLQAEKYVTANQVGVWNNIVSVRIALLSQTADEINFENDGKSYYLAGTVVNGAADKRLRQAYTSTIKIRNRGEL